MNTHEERGELDLDGPEDAIGGCGKVDEREEVVEEVSVLLRWLLRGTYLLRGG